MKRIAHLTSVHPRHDVRVFWKECRTLAAADYAVSLIVADGKGCEEKEKVNIIDVGAHSGGRLSRMIKSTKRVFRKALELDADLYHLHDPELLPVALKLKALGKRVIFDSHEDFPADIMSKPYLGRFARIVVSSLFSVYEKHACRKLDYIVAATPTIREKFKSIDCPSLDINNYPLLDELQELLPWDGERATVCYIGAMTAIRGVPELVDAMAQVKSGARLALVGNFTEAASGDRCRKSPGWSSVDDHGFVGRDEVRKIMTHSVAGVVTFLSAPNHIDAQPNKMFEYMSAGIPVVGSNFPLWKSIIEGNRCGVCVDPANPTEIAEAIDYLFTHQAEAREMGARGRAAVLDKYNWDGEGVKLLSLYREVLSE
ncbi:glycogen synthase, Corynebacterium family [compost metagenome]